MNTIVANNWEVANQRYLSAALSLVRNALEQHIARVRGDLDNLRGAEPAGESPTSARRGEICYACSCDINNTLCILWSLAV